MAKYQRVQYYVEGECEEKLINILKLPENGKQLLAGKVEVINPITEKLTGLRLRQLSPKTLVILVFDTDVSKIDILEYNIDTLMKESNVCEIYLIPQSKDFEDEIIRATSIKRIEEFIPTKFKNEFKREFIREKNLVKKLSQHHFNLNNFWSEEPEGVFAKYENQSSFVKKPRN